MRTMALTVAAFSVLLLSSAPARSQEETKPKQGSGKQKAVQATTTYRSSNLIGMEVRNPEGEELGEIEDLVIDMESGKIRYAALSFGGFLDIGDKLFAVPINALLLKHDEEENYFVLDVDKEKLETAPGFDSDSCPDFGNAKWSAGVDKFYGNRGEAGAGKKPDTHQGQVVSTAQGKLVMTDDAGKKHTHNIGPNVTITLDGEDADLDELQKGQEIEVTTEERNGKKIVTAVEAKSKEGQSQEDEATEAQHEEAAETSETGDETETPPTESEEESE